MNLRIGWTKEPLRKAKSQDKRGAFSSSDEVGNGEVEELNCKLAPRRKGFFWRKCTKLINEEFQLIKKKYHWKYSINFSVLCNCSFSLRQTLTSLVSPFSLLWSISCGLCSIFAIRTSLYRHLQELCFMNLLEWKMPAYY